MFVDRFRDQYKITVFEQYLLISLKSIDYNFIFFFIVKTEKVTQVTLFETMIMIIIIIIIFIMDSFIYLFFPGFHNKHKNILYI